MRRTRKNSQSGMTMIEIMLASGIMLITSLGVVGLITTAIATNNRNKIDSTGTMLAQSVLEQINSTISGNSASTLTDCAGTAHAINIAPGGPTLVDGEIDFTATAATGYSMNFVVASPCSTSGTQRTTYQVRWNIQIVGSTNTYLVTVGARMQNQAGGNMYFSLPINLRMMVGI